MEFISEKQPIAREGAKALSRKVGMAMAEAVTIEPDLTFIEGLMKAGGADLKKCFQCATCSAVCSLSDGQSAFPRQQMIKAQWGLKEELLSDPTIWLCHDCRDCTANCPRGAKPSAVMGALRGEAIKRYAFPRFAANMVSSLAWLPIVLLIPALLFGGVAWLESRAALTRPFVYGELFPQPFLEPLFFAIAGWVLIAFAVGVSRFVRDLRARGVAGGIVSGLVPAFKEIATHERFKKCAAERRRYWGHLLTLCGFGGLALMGTVVGMGTMAGVMHTPLPLLSPWKLFANVCALVVLAGITLLLFPSRPPQGEPAKKTYFDNCFLFAMAGVALTGVLSEVLRLVQNATLMYPIYFVHLILIFALLLFAPYSKFAHIVYRTVAMAAVGAHEKAPLERSQDLTV